MSSISKLFKSAKLSISGHKRNSDSSSGKSVRFVKSTGSIYYTHSSAEYDRKSVPKLEQCDESDSISSIEDEDDYFVFDEEVIRNTKVNMKQGHYSIAAMITYRANM